MLLLTAGFGHDAYKKVWMSLQATCLHSTCLNDNAGLTSLHDSAGSPPSNRLGSIDTVSDVLTGFGCHPEFVPKIYDCLSLSGRYDCCVQYGWVNDVEMRQRLVDELNKVGVECRFDPEYNPPKGYR